MLKSTWLLLSFILGTLCVAVGHWSLFALFLAVVLLPVVSLPGRWLAGKHLNMTVTEYINSEKMYYACELIQSTPLNLSQISTHLGYSDVSYFSRIFKKKFGKAPSKLFPKK